MSLDNEEVLDNVSLNDVEIQHELPTDKIEESPAVPDMDSPEWSNYVMSLFTEDELENDNPKVAGLRRIAKKFLGEMVYSKPKIIQSPNPSNGGNATVEYTIKFLDYDANGNQIKKVFGEVGDAGPENTQAEFAKYASAIASTRAEARALRKALQLKCVASDELDTSTPEGEKSEIVKEIENSTGITSTQINFLDTIAARLNIDVMAYVNCGKTKYSSIKNVPKEVAKQMIEYLSKLQTKGPNEVPVNLRGYKEGWKNND